MAKLKGLTLSKTNVSQTLNLEEILGVSFRGEKDLRLAIAQAVIDYIATRTQDKNVDVNGRPLKDYSKKYIESSVFQLLKDGKTPDMTLTGSMLSNMDVLADGPNTVVIGFTDREEKLKAYNHNVGDTLPKRSFFGVTNKEVKELVTKEFGDELARIKGRDPRKKSVQDILAQGVLVEANNVRIFQTLEDFDVDSDEI